MSKTRRVPDTVTGQFRWHLEHCGETLAEVSRQTGIDSGRLSRFSRGTRFLRAENLDVLAAYLGLRVVRDVD